MVSTGTILLFLLASMGIVATSAITANTMRDDKSASEIVESMRSFIRKCKENYDSVQYNHTKQLLDEFESKGLTEEEIIDRFMQPIEAVKGKTVTIAQDMWDMFREFCNAVATGFTSLLVTTGVIASSAKSVADAGLFTNFNDAYANKYQAADYMELISSLIAEGVSVTAIRTIVNSNGSTSDRKPTTQDLGAYIVAYLRETPPTGGYNISYKEINGIRYSYTTPSSVSTPINLRYVQEDSFLRLKAFDDAGNDISDVVACIRFRVDTIYHTLSEIYSIQNLLTSTDSYYFTSPAINTFIPRINSSLYEDGLIDIVYPLYNSEIVDQKVGFDAWNEVYRKVLTDTTMGDVVTGSNTTTQDNVIVGPKTITIPDSFVIDYPKITTREKDLALSDVIEKAGVKTIDVTRDRAIEKDKVSDKTTTKDAIKSIKDIKNLPVIVPPPTIGITSSGMISLFNPSMSELSSLNDVLWSEDFITNFRKMITDPIDGIISLHAVPISPSTSGRVNVRFGNYDSGISMRKVANQYGTFSCGSILVNERFNNYLDYAPYTKLNLYLPFVGFVPLNTNEVMGSSLAVNYNIDYLTGECIAQVSIYKAGLNAVSYVYNGNMGMELPITGANYSRFYSSLARGALTLGVGAMTGGTGALVMTAGSTALNVAQSAGGDIQKSGSISGNAGFLGDFTPYLITTYPTPNMPTSFNTIEGYLANKRVNLGNVSGYVRVKEIHLKGFTKATSDELSEIESLLKTGVDM